MCSAGSVAWRRHEPEFQRSVCIRRFLPEPFASLLREIRATLARLEVPELEEELVDLPPIFVFDRRLAREVRIPSMAPIDLELLGSDHVWSRVSLTAKV
jgi:hypothetical protein